MDRAVRAADDLFAAMNGTWVATTPIPADRGRYGTFDVLREQAEEHVHDIITEVSQGDAAAGGVAAQVGNLFSSFMDEERVDALGLAPLAAELEAAEAIAATDEIFALLGRWARQGVSGLILPFVSTDDRDSSRYLIHLEQGGLGLPDESYYREDAHADVRTAYVAHVERILAEAGTPNAAEAAARVMTLETRLAAAHADKVTNRDPMATYNLLTADELAARTPGVAWATWLRALGAPDGALDEVIVRQPGYIEAFAAALAEVDLRSWRDWLRWHLVHAHAPYLHAAVVNENFDFYGRTLSGVPEQRARWKRGVALVEGSLGEAVGQLYVERHFRPESKVAMDALVANLVRAFEAAFGELTWMTPQTQANALAKLTAFRPKVGFPDRWRDYSALEVVPGDLIGNVRRAAAFETDRELAKLGGPVDKDEWLITPQTVNAYYHPGLNEIVFPAAILQPPFFDVDADPAVNYGGIGAVIGHEIGHGFDDQGSQYDGDGNLRNWWTDEDREAFTALAARLIAQFDTLETRDAPGETVNGALTVGENIGDLCGLAIGLRAYRLALGGHEAPVIDGLTGDQRFFLGWAQIWRGVSREAEAKRLLALDPHAPMDLRANTARNLDEFHTAFGTQPGDGLWVDPGQRVQIY
ncbi:MAG: peptidase M13 [Phycicoccus sp.]|nr:peptidase M13 [Phycicoccus sp.]